MSDQTTTQTPVDLSQLAIDRRPAAQTIEQGRPRRWISRYVVPGLIVGGFLGLLIATVGVQLAPRPTVQIVPVIVQKGTSQTAGTALFQAAGWIEPRPTSIRVPALTPGVVDQLLVVEGQTIKQGEPIARLIAIDAELEMQTALTTLAIRNGQLSRAQAEAKAAKVRLAQPVHLQIELAGAKSALAISKTALEKLPFEIESALAKLEFAQQSVKGKLAAGSAIPGIVLQEAESELTSASANLHELKRRQPNLQFEVDALQEKVDVLQTQFELLVDETRQLEESSAKVISATALRDESKIGVQRAKLMLERTVIRSPIDGRILRLVAAPGTRVMGMEEAAGQNSSTVVEMYDPNRLQVRADVRLEDVPQVMPGQPVEIETASTEKTIQGRVLQANSSANVQKNTLEVKVELINPPDAIRPEMLVRATFLSPAIGSATEKTQTRQRMMVPAAAVQKDDTQSVVWIVDESNRAQRRPVKIAARQAGDLIEVTQGVRLTDKIIVSDISNLTPNTKVDVGD